MEKKQTYAIILAAGSSSRLNGQVKKQFLSFKNAPLWWQSVKTFYSSPHIHGIVLVFPPLEEEFSEACQEAMELHQEHNLGIPIYFTRGGSTRANSVYNGLEILPKDCKYVLVHDAARPFFSAKLVDDLVNCLKQDPSKMAVIPAIEVTNTIKLVQPASKEQSLCFEEVNQTLERKLLRAVQTPQAFLCHELIKAHQEAKKNNFSKEITDDAMLMEYMKHNVFIIKGEKDNKKITNTEDLQLLETKTKQIPCTGYGYDVHRFGGDRPFILGGVKIPHKQGIHAHSDGDVLLHALMDALLSCLCLGDIGTHFPDSDKQYENISSAILLDKVMDLWKKQPIELCHVDLTIITQSPKISPFAKEIQKNMSRLLGISSNMINVKATTEEKLGFTGQHLGIKAVAIVSALKS